MAKKLTHEAVATSILTEAIITTDSHEEQVKRESMLAYSLTDFNSYVDITNNFYLSDGFAFNLTKSFLERYRDYVSIAKYSHLMSDNRSVNVYTVDYDDDIEADCNTPCILIRDNEYYIPYYEDRNADREMAKRVNRNPKKYGVYALPYERVPELYMYLDVSGRGETLSRSFVQWMESPKPTYCAIVCSHLKSIVDNMMQDPQDKVRKYSDILRYSYIEPEEMQIVDIAKKLGITERTCKRDKVRAITYVAQCLIPLPVAGQGKMSIPVFGDDLLLYSSAISEADAAKIMKDFRLKYSLADEIDMIKELLELGALDKAGFTRYRSLFMKRGETLKTLAKYRNTLDVAIAYRERNSAEDAAPRGMTVLLNEEKKLPPLEELKRKKKTIELLIKAKEQEFLSFYEKDSPIFVKEMTDKIAELVHLDQEAPEEYYGNALEENIVTANKLDAIIERLSEIREEVVKKI